MHIYFIFSQDGYEEVIHNIIADKATLWLNKDFLSESQLTTVKQQNIDIHTFAEHVDGSNEKSILKALEAIEKDFPTAEILIEYL